MSKRWIETSKDDAVRALLNALANPDVRSVRKAWDDLTRLYGQVGAVMKRAAFEKYLDELAGIQ
jgi:hypothetical protein